MTNKQKTKEEFYFVYRSSLETLLMWGTFDFLTLGKGLKDLANRSLLVEVKLTLLFWKHFRSFLETTLSSYDKVLFPSIYKVTPKMYLFRYFQIFGGTRL